MEMLLGIDLGPHASFIWAAYGAVALVIGALIAWLYIDGRIQQRKLAVLAERGVLRRSARRA